MLSNTRPYLVEIVLFLHVRFARCTATNVLLGSRTIHGAGVARLCHRAFGKLALRDLNW